LTNLSANEEYNIYIAFTINDELTSTNNYLTQFEIEPIYLNNIPIRRIGYIYRQYSDRFLNSYDTSLNTINEISYNSISNRLSSHSYIIDLNDYFDINIYKNALFASNSYSTDFIDVNKHEKWCNEFASSFLLPGEIAKKIFEETFFLLDEFIRIKSNNNIMVWGNEVVKREDYFKLMSYNKGSILDGKVIDLDLMVDITLDLLLFILGKLKQEGTIYLEYTDTLRFYFITEYEVYTANKFKIIDGKVKRIL
jgi:hypothetical protein